MAYVFATLDPRPVDAARVANDAVFAYAEHGVLGIEVTVPDIAERCTLGNIDPQHGEGGNASLAAIQVALECDLPRAGATLATVRPDLDSVGAMAVLNMRDAIESMPTHRFDGDVAHRIRLVAEADTFARGPWPGPRRLPSQDNPWPAAGGAAETRELAAMAACVADHRTPLRERVGHMAHWLVTGEEPAEYRRQVEAERTEMIRALEAGEIEVFLAANDCIAVVCSTHQAALSVGYAYAPVVIAENPAFRLGDGESHRKLTVAAYDSSCANIRGALDELAELESGWGGSPTIGGSPQGVSSKLTINQVVNVLSRHLLGDLAQERERIG